MRHVLFKAFLILLSQDGFKYDPAIQKQSSKKSLHKISSEAAVRRYSSKKVFLKIPHRCFPVNIAKFLRAVFLQNPPVAAFFSLIKQKFGIGLFIGPLRNQKHNVRGFLLNSFVDLFRVLYIISRNHFYTFLLINLQKTKTCPK